MVRRECVCNLTTAVNRIRLISNKFLKDSENTNENVEWLYSFDIHTNSFFPLFIILYVIQYFLLPILQLDNIISTILADLLYLAAFSYYNYMTFRGYLNLQFIKNSEVFLYPIGLIILITIVSIATGKF